MSQHLTSRFWLCAVLGWGSVLLAVLVKEVEPLALGLPFIWALVFSFVDGWWPHASIDEITLSSIRIVEGDKLMLSMVLSSSRPVPWFEVEVQVPALLTPVGTLRTVGSLPANTVRPVNIELVANRWGVTGPQWITIVGRDRLGMTERVQHVAVANRVRVHPPTERLTSLIPLEKTRQVTGDHRSTRRGGGTELAEVRPYRSGDPVRMIHSRLSARRGTPMVLERHPDQSADIVIFVDSVQDIGAGLETSLRWTVTAAIALTQRHLRSMDRVGVLDRGAGVRWLPPELGRRALHNIVDALLSTVVLQGRAGDQQTVPVARIPRGATVFCVSPLISTVVRQDLVVLRRRGHEVIVIQPEMRVSGAQGPGAAGSGISAPSGLGQTGQDRSGSMLAERVFRVGNEVTRRSLTEQGIVVIPWNPNEPLEPTLQRMGQHLGRFRSKV